MAAASTNNFLSSLATGNYSSLAAGDELAPTFAPPALDMNTAALLEGITRSTTQGPWNTARDTHRS